MELFTFSPSFLPVFSLFIVGLLSGFWFVFTRSSTLSSNNSNSNFNSKVPLKPLNKIKNSLKKKSPKVSGIVKTFSEKKVKIEEKFIQNGNHKNNAEKTKINVIQDEEAEEIDIYEMAKVMNKMKQQTKKEKGKSAGSMLPMLSEQKKMLEKNTQNTMKIDTNTLAPENVQEKESVNGTQIKNGSKSKQPQQTQQQTTQQQFTVAEGWHSQAPSKATEMQNRKLNMAKQEEQKGKTNGELSNEGHEHGTPEEQRITIQIDVPLKAHPRIIGQRGVFLQMLQTATGAGIDFPKKEMGSTTVSLTGTQTQVTNARNNIEALVTKSYSAVTHPGWVHDDISVPQGRLGAIIGQQGTTLRTIQTKTGTVLTIPEKNTNDKIIIAGPKECVKLARTVIKQLIVEDWSPLINEGEIRDELEFPRDKHAWLIGAKGQTIKSIQGNTKTRIRLPQSFDQNQNVVIYGTEADVAQAKREIMKLIEPREIFTVMDTNDVEDGEITALDEAWTMSATTVNGEDVW